MSQANNSDEWLLFLLGWGVSHQLAHIRTWLFPINLLKKGGARISIFCFLKQHCLVSEWMAQLHLWAHYCKVFTDDLSYTSKHHSSLSDDLGPWKDFKYFLKETFANIFVSCFLVGLLGGCGILNNSICSIETYQLCRWVCSSTAVVVSYCCKKWWSEDQPWVVLPFTILQTLPSAHWWIWSRVYSGFHVW